MFDITHFGDVSLSFFQTNFAWRIALAAFLGALLGLERTIAGKHAGMRTYALVSMGSAFFVIISIISSYQFAMFAGLNPLFIVGNIVVGIGFIGSGLAFARTLEGAHPELTTAAGLWVVAAVGMACGFGYYALALVVTFITFLIFSLVLNIENTVRRRFKINNE